MKRTKLRKRKKIRKYLSYPSCMISSRSDISHAPPQSAVLYTIHAHVTLSASPIIAVTPGCDSTASNRYCSRQIPPPPFFPALPVILAVVITREEVLRMLTSFEVVSLVFGLIRRVKALAPARIKPSWTKADVAVIIEDLERQRSSLKYVDRSPRPSQIITGLD